MRLIRCGVTLKEKQAQHFTSRYHVIAVSRFKEGVAQIYTFCAQLLKE